MRFRTARRTFSAPRIRYKPIAAQTTSPLDSVRSLRLLGLMRIVPATIHVHVVFVHIYGRFSYEKSNDGGIALKYRRSLRAFETSFATEINVVIILTDNIHVCMNSVCVYVCARVYIYHRRINAIKAGEIYLRVYNKSVEKWKIDYWLDTLRRSTRTVPRSIIVNLARYRFGRKPGKRLMAFGERMSSADEHANAPDTFVVRCLKTILDGVGFKLLNANWWGLGGFCPYVCNVEETCAFQHGLSLRT